MSDPKTTAPAWEGAKARRDGKPVDACPYEPGPQRTAWVTGWYVAAPEEPANAQF